MSNENDNQATAVTEAIKPAAAPLISQTVQPIDASEVNDLITSAQKVYLGFTEIRLLMDIKNNGNHVLYEQERSVLTPEGTEKIVTTYGLGMADEFTREPIAFIAVNISGREVANQLFFNREVRNVTQADLDGFSNLLMVKPNGKGFNLTEVYSNTKGSING